MNKIKLFLLDLFFPNRCAVCNEITIFDKYVCDDCMKKLLESAIDEEKVCGMCGKYIGCSHDDLWYSRAVSCFYYIDCVREGIYSLKEKNRNFGYYIAGILADTIKSDEILKNADYIIAVPMSKDRLRKRGYNQAEVIAKEVSCQTGIPLLKKVLFKNKSAVQHLLSYEERLKNVDSIYSSETNLEGKKIIVCDDVLTTGSTVNRCAKLLINMNAADVYAAVGTIVKHKI
ncbi:MAG: ComF family protein [Oscillospiraceae bacterium]|nr:ComF family protein [Oscillospiraceae bacterium]